MKKEGQSKKKLVKSIQGAGAVKNRVYRNTRYQILTAKSAYYLSKGGRGGL
jgi:hypothetical protein